MASGGRRGAGERVLESRHVIGLFLLMLVFSGVFFALGYVMGRNQYAGQVGANNDVAARPEPVLVAKPAPAPKKSAEPPATPIDSDPATSSANNSNWEFYDSNKSTKPERPLEAPSKVSPAPAATKSLNVKSKVEPPPAAARPATGKTSASTPLIPNGALLLQVAALARQDDALALATSLQKKHFSAYVQTPQKDKYYRVQVGPFKDQKSADAVKKGLESAGFKAFYVKH